MGNRGASRGSARFLRLWGQARGSSLVGCGDRAGVDDNVEGWWLARGSPFVYAPGWSWLTACWGFAGSPQWVGGVVWRICKAPVCHLFVSTHIPHSAAAFLSQCVCWLCSLMTSSGAVSEKLTYVLDGQCVYDGRWWWYVYERHRDRLSLGFTLDYNSCLGLLS